MNDRMPCPTDVNGLQCGRPDVQSKRQAVKGKTKDEIIRHYECEAGHRFHIPFQMLRPGDAEILRETRFLPCDRLRCKRGHDHPPEPVWVTVDNPTLEPHGEPRPYHCGACSERTKEGHRPDYWQSFDTPHATGRRACLICFPSN